MAKDDFEEQIYGQGPFAPTWVSYGLETLNSGISDPLTDAGTYCRNLRAAITNTSDQLGLGSQLFGIKATVQSGAFVSVPATKRIDVRAWVRNVNSNEHRNVGVFAKAPWGRTGSIPSEAWQGYRLRLGTIDAQNHGDAFALRLSAPAIDGSSGSPAQVVCTTGGGSAYVHNAWYRIRLTAESTGVDDVIKAYRGAGATDSETWTEVGSLVVPAASNGFVAWGRSDTRIGFYGATVNGGGTTPHNVYVDSFKAIVETI